MTEWAHIFLYNRSSNFYVSIELILGIGPTKILQLQVVSFDVEKHTVRVSVLHVYSADVDQYSGMLTTPL